MMMTKEEADKWAKEIYYGGTHPIQQAYLEKFGAGEIAKGHWNDPTFTLGLEYGILIAIEKIYGNLEEVRIE